MARQAGMASRNEREVDQPRWRTSARISSAQEVPMRYVPKEPSSIQRPVREAPNLKDAQNLKNAKVKQIVSAAGIFKKKPKVNPREKKQYRHREPTPESDLVADFRDGIEIARDALNANAKATFDDVHAALSERLSASKAVDESFFQRVAEATKALSAPLVHEKIETTISKEGKRRTEVVEIGNRVATFKKIIEKEGAKLKDYWQQWDEVQNEYMELGIEVFGPEVFGEDALSLKISEKGFKREMELLDLEHDTSVRELDEEIEDTSAKFLQKMKASEKELDVAAKKEQARLLQALIQD